MMQKTKREKVYKDFNDIYLSYPHADSVTKAQFKLILKTFNYLLIKSMVDEGKVYQLPKKLGVMGVFKLPVAGRGVFDYKLFHTDGTKLWRKNLHSSSYAAQFKWKLLFPRTDLPTYISKPFRWNATRYWRRYLARQIKENNTINLYYDKNEY